MADAGPDQLLSAADGTPRDAGSANTISGTVQGAVDAANARMTELESDTLHPGMVVGDRLAIPELVFSDTTELQEEPGTGAGVPSFGPMTAAGPAHQGGSYNGSGPIG